MPIVSLPTFASPPATDDARRAKLARELANIVAGEVRFGLHDRMLYATDASLYQVEPIGVVIPASIEDAVRVVRWCALNKVALLPRGGGTSLAGQCTAHAVVMDFSNNCRGVLEVDVDGGLARVEPGVTIDDFNDGIAQTPWFFAADPATSRHANFGGCVGNNAAGSRSIKYGRTSESVLGLDAALVALGYEGRIVRFERGASEKDEVVRDMTARVCEVVARHAPFIRKTYPKTLRRNAGYGLDMVLGAMEAASWRDGQPISPAVLAGVNLAHLLCGSEGTLAVTLAAHVKLHRKPKAKGLAVLGFDTLDGAIEVVPAVLSTGPTAVELLDDTVIDLANANTEYRRYVDLMPKPEQGALKAVLYVEYFGDGPEEIAAAFEGLRRAVPVRSAQFHTDAQAMLNAWKLRKAGEPLLHGIPGHRKPITFIEDNAIPVENLAVFVKTLRAIVEKHGTRAAFYAHASVGVLHVRPLLDVHDPADRERMRAISVETADLAKSLGGVMSGEHGDGRIRGPLLERFYGPELMTAFREIKVIFDPNNILNPGNIVESRPLSTITDNLRVEPASNTSLPARPVAVPLDVETYFDYSDQHGFDGAVEMCNGAGVCRKTQGGTMCPSYQALLDERHSTRGRGNALRLAITGQFAGRSPSPGRAGGKGEGEKDSGPSRTPNTIWDDAGTKETLNLCLSCKACKTECPSNVDISRLKAEYAAQGMKAAGSVPFQVRFFGAIRLLNRLGSLTPGIANWINSTRIAKSLANRVLNIDPRRSLPPFAKSLGSSWGATRAAHPQTVQRDANDRSPRVALFGDCFTMFNEPGIGLATKRIYEAFGYEVLLANAGCCGRAKISLGNLAAAISEVDATLDRLRPLIEEAGVQAILVAEPSCLSAMKDDWLALKLRTPLALRKQLAAKAFLPEDYLNKMWDAHPARPAFNVAAEAAPVLLHTHCHQKALWGAETSAACLRRVFGDRLKVLDTGCCGMAGSFGFTADRYDLSMKIANLTLCLLYTSDAADE